MVVTHQHGLTLVELLIVISIIGILVTVVFTTLSGARSDGQDAKVEASIHHARGDAELYWDNNNKRYDAALCTDPTITDVADAVAAEGSSLGCTADTSAFVIWAQLPSTLSATATYYCIDNAGFSGRVGAAPSGSVCN